MENDPPNPQGVYGQSKLEGEVAVAEENPRHIILRTSWVYAPFGQNFVRTMLRIGNELDRVWVVNDQYGCPTYAPDVARAILDIAQELGEGRHHYTGVTHIAGTNVMSWYEFAQKIFRQSEARGGPSPVVDPINSSEYPTAAARPANSELSTERLLAAFNITLPPTEVSLSACLDRLFAQRGIS
jgi:dTDP-4-dehydrorhamnose reductase